jgi:hypothetical protein
VGQKHGSVVKNASPASILYVLALVGVVLSLAACATFRQPDAWTRIDRGPSDPSIVAAAAAECRAQAELAGAHGDLSPLAFAQYAQNSPQDYVVVPPPGPSSYQAPQVDFSPLGDAGTSLRQQMDRDRLIRSVLEGCMAQRGYILAQR